MSTDDKIQLMRQFYSSFQQRDHAGMIACYHPQIAFSDSVFPDLKGKQAGAMWHMLCERGKDLVIQFQPPHLQGDNGTVHWEATYTFSSTQRRVHNIVDATMAFADGKIIAHTDRFDLWRWTRMALGTSGVLLGWSPMVRNKVRATALAGLLRFLNDHPEYQ